MARETRKLKRAQSTAPSAGKAARDANKGGASKRGDVPDPLGQGQLRSMLTRLGLILLGVWILLGSIASFVSSPWTQILLGVAVLLTGAAIAAVVWTLRQAKTARGVASILSSVETDDDRKAALEKLSTD